MLTAVDISGNKHFIDDANKDEQYYCPICQQRLMQRRKGEKRRPHFAHYGLRDIKYVPCTDKWKYDKTEWHYNWQLQFPLDNYEYVVDINGKKHIADVLINNTVIEFQHSGITLDEFTERNEFYNAAGYEVIWVFDLQKEFKDGHIHKEIWNGDEYRWSYVKKPFKEMDLNKTHAHIFFQLVTAENKNTPVLELVNKAYSGFWGFATATNTLSTEQFTKLVSSGEIQSLFKDKAVTEVVENVSCIEKRENTLFDNENLQVQHAHAEEYPKIQEKLNYSFPEKPQKPANPNGKTVMQLWNPDYQFMVIKNSTNDDSILINGINGHIETNTWGKIIGSYSNYNINTNRYYYSKKYVVKDAYEPIWMLITFRETEEAQLRKRIKPITDAQTLDEIFESTEEPEILVHCLDNNKYYVINILYENKRFTRDFFNSLELDITTGEIIEGTRNGFCNSRRSIQIWKRIR